MPESLDKRLLAYALAAGAGLAAAPELAQATIVYTNPADQSIFTNGAFINIDLNNDGINDVRVTIDTFSASDVAEANLRVGGNGQPTGVIGDGTFASALLAGATIGPLQSFQSVQSSTRLMAHAYASYDGDYYSGFSGPFAPNTSGRFLGLSFQIDGADHFGWARFNVFTEQGFAGENQPFAQVSATLTDYAFENCPREAISAGATQGGASCPSGVPMPPALALVALGAGGLALWRAHRRD